MNKISAETGFLRIFCCLSCKVEKITLSLQKNNRNVNAGNMGKLRSDVIKMTTNDALILSKVANSEVIPEIAFEMVAVRKGMIAEEGIIPRKLEFESYIKKERWIRLQRTGLPWQKDICVECVSYSKPNIKFYLIADFCLIDDVAKNVYIIISDFSMMTKKEIIQAYSEKIYVTKIVAEDVWKGYSTQIFVWQYESRLYDYEGDTCEYDSYRNNAFQIRTKSSIQFDIKKALQTLNDIIPTYVEYVSAPIPFDDLATECQHSIDDLNRINLHTVLSNEALNRFEQTYTYNKRRIKNYLIADKELSVMKMMLDQFYSRFSKMYDRILEGEE